MYYYLNVNGKLKICPKIKLKLFKGKEMDGGL